MSRRSKEKKKRREAEELLTRRELEAREIKRAKRLRLILVIVAIVSVIAIVAVGVTALVVNIINSAKIDYERDDLGRYIYISPDDYKGYLAEVTADAIDDVAIDSALIQNLATYRTAPEGAKGRWFFPSASTVLGVGDAVRIYYRGYTVDENGRKVAFDGGSNIPKYDGDSNIDDTAAETYIGEGGFIDGFELGLVGTRPADYSTLRLITDRAVAEGDFISITCSITPPDASTSQQDVVLLIELTEDAADSVYGLGFFSRFIGKLPGEKVDSFATDDCYGVDGKTVFTDVKVNYIYDLGDDPMTVTARFPIDYDEESLAGKICYFDIYVKQYNDYTVPEIDDEFLSEKLGLTSDEIAGYEGDTAFEKYRSFIRSEVEATDKKAIASLVESVMWETYLDAVTVNSLPPAEVKEYYDDYVDEIQSAYNSAASNGNASSLDGYALTYLNLEPSDDWRAYLYSVAEQRVTEKLIFYYIVRAEGLVPEGEEFDRLYNETVDEYIVSYLEYMKKGTTPEDYETEAEFIREWSAAREEVFKIYDEDYFRENVIYLSGIDALIEMADLSVSRGPSITEEQYTPIIL